MGNRHDEKFWNKLIRNYEQGEFGQREFCEKHSVCLSTFKDRLYKIRQEQDECRSLVEVEFEQQLSVQQPIEANLPGGVLLRFMEGTDPNYVAALIVEVENVQC